MVPLCELPVRLRSDDLPLTRRLLYQLSYGSITGILHACPVAGSRKKTSQTKEEKTGRFLVGKSHRPDSNR